MLATSLFGVLAFLAPLALSVPAPIPSGGVGVRSNDTPPVYATMSDFDFQSLNLALNQEWIELDLFNYSLQRFSAEEFAAAGLDAEDMSLIQFMADQEVGHATLLHNIVTSYGRVGAEPCTYSYRSEPVFDTVRE